MKAVVAALVLASLTLLVGARSDYTSITQKFRSIQKNRIAPGSRISLSARELNAYVQTELPKVAPEGIRSPEVELPGGNVAVGKALINFVKLQSSDGQPPNWMVRSLLEGEHQVTVTAELQSSDGYATVNLKRLMVDSLPIQGPALDFLIRNYLIPNYPDAKIGTPFKLAFNMDRLEIAPGVAYVVMAKR